MLTPEQRELIRQARARAFTGNLPRGNIDFHIWEGYEKVRRGFRSSHRADAAKDAASARSK